MNTSAIRAAVTTAVLLSSMGTSTGFAQYIIGVPVGFTAGTAPLVRIDPATGAMRR